MRLRSRRYAAQRVLGLRGDEGRICNQEDRRPGVRRVEEDWRSATTYCQSRWQQETCEGQGGSKSGAAPNEVLRPSGKVKGY
ncbi:hypothetical protein EON65_01650 [archaeon]|nr:MAG: hypothetical protein EON65_01650 [archaeon]